ncbi:MAG TPA: WYL domain-containing protein, partial [Mycobacteriales bacterium]|nr:WYL domain-containing protein [Mycobacteriales bacterium]
MSSRRAERLVNLVLCLLSTRQYLTAERIRAAVPGYEPDDGNEKADDAFKRMFERDKAELRELGVPLEIGRNSAFDTEDGYRIARRDYELPDISLAPEEAAAVGLAARLWKSAGLAEAARGALLKLRAAGIEVDPVGQLDVEPRLDATEDALHPCLDAVQSGRAVAFTYQKPDGASERREVEPWGVVSWRGRWYLVGHDRGRDAARCFRLSRVNGAVRPIGPDRAVKVPTGIDLVGYVAAFDPGDQRKLTRLRVRHGAATGLRRISRLVERGDETGLDTDLLETWYVDPEWIADRIAGHGAAVVVLDPPEVRDAVIHRLRARAARPDGSVPAAGVPRAGVPGAGVPGAGAVGRTADPAGSGRPAADRRPADQRPA